MSDFKCRSCGNNEYVLVSTKPWLKACRGCSAVFTQETLFSMERELRIQYLDNYDMDWGEINYKHLYDSGADLKAAISEPVTIYPYCDIKYKNIDNIFVKIPFGIKVDFSHSDMYLEIFNRSGLSSKNGVRIRNNVGVIDNAYRGQIMGFFENCGDRPYTIEPGERVTQMIVKNKIDVNIVKVDEVCDTERGSDGFGSTGKK